jgi:hypothetical protein
MIEGIYECPLFGNSTLRWYRGLVAAFYVPVTLFIWSQEQFETLMWMTLWYEFFTTSYFVMAVLERPGAKVPSVVFLIAWTGEIALTVMYWPFVYPHIPDEERLSMPANLVVHLLPAILLLIDHIISRTTVQISNLKWPMLVCISYGIVLIIVSTTYR